MTSETLSYGYRLRHSYLVLESWIPHLTYQHSQVPDDTATAEDNIVSTATILNHARELLTYTRAFDEITYGKQPVPPVLEQCHQIIENIALTILTERPKGAQLESANLALRLITPLAKSLTWLPSDETAPLSMKEENLQARIAKLKDHQVSFERKITEIGARSSEIIAI